MKDVEIERLTFSVRTYNVLKNNDINCLSQVLRLEASEIASFRGAGKMVVDEIRKLQLSYMESKCDSDADYRDIIPNPNPSLLFITFPELKTVSSYEILYVHENGVETNDYFFNESDFSVRTYNALTAANILNIKTIYNLTLDEAKEIKNLGNKSYNEILLFLKNHLKYVDTNSKNYISFNYLLSLFPLEYREDITSFNSDTLNTIIKNSFQNISKNLSQLTIEEIDANLFNSETEKWMSTFILNNISKSTGITKDSLSRISPKLFVNNRIFNIAFENLLINRKIEKSLNDEYRIKKPTLGEWLSTLPEKERILINIKINGGTLQDCGDYLGITRERARQIIARSFKKRPSLKEDDYFYWFTKYNLSKDLFSNIFEESERTYEYLKINYNKGNSDYLEILDDSLATKKIYKNIKTIKERNCITINNKLISIRRLPIIKELARENFHENDACIDVLFDCYMKFLEDNNLLSNNFLLFPNKRSFEARVQSQHFVLSKQWRRFRYYDIDEVDIETIINQLNFNQYKNIEISAKKLLIENQDLFKEIDIKDEYELHNLLKKTITVWNPDNKYNVSFDRMPEIVFGTASIEDQVVNLLKSSAPISTKDFWKLYEQEYGNSSASAMANYNKYINKYFSNGEYKIDMPSFNKEESQFMKSKIVNDFYTLDEVKAIYYAKFNDDSNKINSMNLKELGYKVYSGYILKSTFSSIDAYLKKIILQSNTFDIHGKYKDIKMSSYLSTSAANSLYSVLDELKQNKTIFEYADGKFIKSEHFFSVAKGLSYEIIDEFVEQTIDFAKEEEFFTIESLIKKGFYDRFESLGFGNYFSAALLKNSKKIKFAKFGGNIIFYNSKEVMFTKEFVMYAFSNYISIDADKFQSLLRDFYSIYLPKEKIIECFKESDCYYSQIMNKIYRSKDDYYDDISI